MGKKAIIWLCIAATLVVLGAGLFVGAMAASNWDFSTHIETGYQVNSYPITTPIRNIEVRTDIADLVLVPTDGSEASVSCSETEEIRFSVSVEAGTLMIREEHNQGWLRISGFNFQFPKVVIHLPATEYEALLIREDIGDIDIPEDFHFGKIDIEASTGDVTCLASAAQNIKIRTGTGNIRVQEADTGTLELTVSTGGITASDITCTENFLVQVSTGKADIRDVRCKTLHSSGTTGDISLQNVIAEESFSVTRSTGDISLVKCDASELTLTTSTGDITGSLLSGKVFSADSNTGSARIPPSGTGGSCELRSGTGDIRITLDE